MIRPLSVEDKKIYIEMAHEFYSTDAVWHTVPQDHFEKTFNELIRSDVYAEGFAFEYNCKVVGYALIAKTFSQEAGGLVVWIEEIYVKPEFRDKGLGGEFLKFIEKERPAVRYRLEIEPENERAVALYQKNGFTMMPYGQMCKGK